VWYSQPTSPTLKQLLLWEKEHNLHPRLPRLNDKSGASGLLWIVRQLQYQTIVFQNIVQVPFVFPSAKDAVLAAYKATYNDYHGFLVKKVFQSSLDAAPAAEAILAHMSLTSSVTDSDNLEAVTEAMTDDDDDYEDNISIEDSIESKEEAINDDQQEVAEMAQHPFDHVVNHIAKEWMKLERFMSQCTGQDAGPDPSKNILDTRSMNLVASSATLAKKESAAAFASIQTAEQEIPAHVAVVEPIIQGLDKMIRDLNMNDPSKC